ncbi:TRAP transporter substrate-binding protein [Acidisphaera sp. L21]|uniref:TRAP transporter substrate-binding protein n=1 Tax=Acidisphaera sp. L21 TaxID=1641851 RepID=UPI00131D672A|nr:TRAP transporter substrate-binding protein [Acidisphaera sp. L21]
MSTTRRHLMLQGTAMAAVAAVNLSPRRARAAEFNLRFGHGYPDTHPLNVRAREAAARIKDESKGRVVIDMYPNSQLGGDSDLLNQVRSGAVDFFSTGGLILSTLVKPAAISGMGFAFSDYDKVWPAMDGELGAYVRDAFAKSKLHAMTRIWDNGFRQITTSNRAIATPQDLQGFKIRVPVSTIYTSLFKALGSAPTSINLGEVYSALQTHICDGQENPLIVVDTTKFYEVQKFVSMTNHIWDGNWVLANGDTWASLPADLQGVVERNFDASAMDQRADILRLNTSLRDTLAGRGLAVNTPDSAPFKQKLRDAGFYASWQGQFGAQGWDLLEKYVGKLA